MNQESEFETFAEQPFAGELEDERSQVRSLGRQQARYAAAMRKNGALRRQYSTLKGQQYRKRPSPPRPRGNRFPIRFPMGGGSMYPQVLGADPNQWSTPNGANATQAASCSPCNCPSCADQSSATQPPMDQPVMDQPGIDQPDTSQAQGSGYQPDMDQEPGDKELWEFFNPQNELELASEYQNWTSENGATQGSADPRIIDLTARADKSRRLRMRDPKKVHALVLHQMACCFKVKDPLTRFLKMAPHFAILPDGRILQLHPILALTGASNGFNAGSVAVEFAGNFPDTKGKWWHGPQNGMNQVTPAQIEAGRYLVRYLIRTMGLKTILAHRQSSGTRDNDPGPDIWFHVGQWAIDNLGLKDGGPGFKVGTGNAIPDLWRKWGQAKPQPELEFQAHETNGYELEIGVNRNPGYIKWIQQSLNKILGLNLATDGIMGTRTSNAIRSFQKRSGLGDDGLVGAQTEAAMIRAGAAPPNGAPTGGTTTVDFEPQVVTAQPVNPQRSTFALVQAIPDDPNDQNYTTIDYRLDAKQIVGDVAQDFSSNGKNAHFWVDLAHFGLTGAEIFAELLPYAAATTISGLAVLGPVLAVVAVGLGLGAPYYEAGEKIAEDWSARGFSRGVVMGADERKAALLNDYFGNDRVEDYPFEHGHTIAVGNYKMGLMVGFAHGRLLSPFQRDIFWRDIGNRMGYQSYRGPNGKWSRSEWRDWYTTIAIIFRRDHLTN